MKNNKIDINVKELDQLLNESFLEVDFNTSTANRAMLDVVAKNALHPSGQFSFLAGNRLHQFFLAVSFLIFLNSLYRYTTTSIYTVPEKFITSPSHTAVGKKEGSIKDVTAIDKQERSKNSATKTEQVAALKVEAHKDKKSIRSKKIRKYPEKKISSTLIMPAVISDSLCEETAPVNNVDSAEHKIARTQKNSLETEPGNKSAAADAISTKRPGARANFKENSTKSMKAKKVRKKRKTLFQKDGTFMLKGSKYRKSKI